MNIAIVDIGSNAIKYKIFDSNNMELKDYYREPLRLGRDVFTNGRLSNDNCEKLYSCLLYTSPSPRDKRQSRMPSSA